MADETVRTKLEFDAAQALDAMKKVQQQAETTAGKAQLLAQQVADYSRSLGQNWKKTLQQMKATGLESGIRFTTPLGKDVTEDVYKNTKATLENAQAKDKLVTADNKAAASTRNFAGEVKKTTGTISLFGHGIDAIRTALGTLVAVGIFTVLTAVTEFFRGAIDQARQFEETLYRISNAERQLSQAGLEVTVSGLKKGIDDIQEALPIFSKEDVAQLIGSLATTTKELGFTEDQILKLGAAVAILNINSTETESVLQTQAKVTNSLVSPMAKSIGSLGLAFGKLKIEAKGAELGIQKTMEQMTDAEKTKIKFEIILETAGLENIEDISKLREIIQEGGGDFEALNEYLNSNTARLAANGAAWKDLQTTIGQVFLPFLPTVTSGLKLVENGFNGLKFVLIEFMTILGATIGTIQELMAAPLDADFGKIFEEGMVRRVAELRKDLVNTFFVGGLPDSASQGIKDLYEPLIKPPRETPTVAQTYEEEMGKAEDAVEESEAKIIDIMADARDKRAKIDEDYRRKIEDANRDHQQKLADIARDTQRKQDDALRNYNQKVEDINRDANEKIAEANADARQKELDNEAEYQRRLRELRERFLLDLEDALRERDARQVLRLIKEYNLDKKNLEEKRKLDRQEARKDLAQKLADIERDRQLKLEAARRELAEKQAEIKLWAERERADAQIALQRKLADAREWHRRELQEYQQYLQRKLQELARAIVKEYQLTAAGAQAIYRLLQGYFGANGNIAQLLGQGLNANLNTIVSSSGGGGGGGSNPGFSGSGMYGTFAEGGTYVATRPTKAIFGERGPEIAAFKPIGRTGQDVNKLFGDVSPSDGQNSLSLRVMLSDGLIADIVDTSLDSVSAVIEKIGREK